MNVGAEAEAKRCKSGVFPSARLEPIYSSYVMRHDIT